MASLGEHGWCTLHPRIYIYDRLLIACIFVIICNFKKSAKHGILCAGYKLFFKKTCSTLFCSIGGSLIMELPLFWFEINTLPGHLAAGPEDLSSFHDLLKGEAIFWLLICTVLVLTAWWWWFHCAELFYAAVWMCFYLYFIQGLGLLINFYWAANIIYYSFDCISQVYYDVHCLGHPYVKGKVGGKVIK